MHRRELPGMQRCAMDSVGERGNGEKRSFRFISFRFVCSSLRPGLRSLRSPFDESTSRASNCFHPANSRNRWRIRVGWVFLSILPYYNANCSRLAQLACPHWISSFQIRRNHLLVDPWQIVRFRSLDKPHAVGLRFLCESRAFCYVS